MKIRFLIPAILILVVLFGGVVAFRSLSASFSGRDKVTPTPTPLEVEQLPADKQPKVSLTFTPDGHYITVNINSIFAQGLEYNLIYDATVKKNQIQTGVTASANSTIRPATAETAL